MSIFDMKDGINTNFDLYAMMMEDAEQRRLAKQIEEELMQENLGKKNKNLFYK